MSRQCVKCQAKCCRYFSFQIDEPTDYEAFENIRWFLCHEGVSVNVCDGDWYISIENKCKWLGADNRCIHYDDRPLICRTYAQADCDDNGGDYEFDELFETPGQLEAYARKTLGPAVFERTKARQRAKLERKPKTARAAAVKSKSAR